MQNQSVRDSKLPDLRPSGQTKLKMYPPQSFPIVHCTLPVLFRLWGLAPIGSGHTIRQQKFKPPLQYSLQEEIHQGTTSFTSHISTPRNPLWQVKKYPQVWQTILGKHGLFYCLIIMEKTSDEMNQLDLLDFQICSHGVSGSFIT